MITSFYQALFSSGNNELLLNFKAGYFTGVTLVLGLMLLWAIGRLIYIRKARKRMREIIIPGANGDLIISVAAISDMVKAIVYEKFKHINVDKLTIWKTPRGMEMDLRGVYKLDGEHLPDVSDAMREEIFKNLEENFGIRSIMKINCGV
ncbi:MAG: hypothetical protein GXP32_05310 [Kiritimatiellaeota bacterium]|nr:hypothetical protein [Kiritimatiellota bacterium]